MNTSRGTVELVRIHLPEWRDSLAVNQEIRRALRAGRGDFLLTGARGDRLLLNGVSGPYAARILIEGDAGTELARDLDAENLVVVVTGSAGSGAGMGMKSGTLFVHGGCGALLGCRMNGGAIWALGEVGSRAGYAATGGVIRLANPPGPMALDRSDGGRIERIQPDHDRTKQALATAAAILSFRNSG